MLCSINKIKWHIKSPHIQPRLMFHVLLLPCYSQSGKVHPCSSPQCNFWVAKILKGDFLWEKRYIENKKGLMFKASSWSCDAYPLAQLRVDEGQVLKRKQDFVGPFDQLDLLDSPPTKIRQHHTQLIVPSIYSWNETNIIGSYQNHSNITLRIALDQ